MSSGKEWKSGGGYVGFDYTHIYDTQSLLGILILRQYYQNMFYQNYVLGKFQSQGNIKLYTQINII